MEITTYVSCSGEALFYLSMYPEITMRGEQIPVVLKLMVKKRERWKKRAS